MCNIVVINKGEKEIGTPRQFLEYFGFIPDISPIINMDECLCNYDIELIFNKNNIAYKKDCGDYYVGMLDDVVGDND